jgi:hypothetical protein
MIIRLEKFIFILFIISFFGCTKDQNSACNSNIYTNEICSIQYIINGKNEKIEQYQYQNYSLHLIESVEKNRNITNTLLEYENGKIIKKTTTDYYGKVLNTIEYKFKNDILEKEIYDQDSVIEFYYKNQLINKVKYLKDNYLVTWDTILYYPNQKIFQQKKYSKKNDLVKIEEFRWFVNNTFIQETILPNGIVTKKIIHNTNSQNQIIQQNIYNQNGVLIEQNKKSYENNLLIYESFNKILSNEILEKIYHRAP